MGGRRWILVATVVIGLAVAGVATVAGVPRSPERVARLASPLMLPGARLDFDEEFNETSLNRRVWTTCYQFAVRLDTDGCTNQANGELQWYLPSQVKVQDGNAVLTAEESPAEGRANDGSPRVFAYRSGMLTTATSYNFTYGYVEIRAKLPFDAGLWPALWMAPSDYSWPPEIDIVEAFGQREGQVGFTFHAIGGLAPEQHTTVGDVAAFHTYGLLWAKDEIVWYLDEKPVFSVGAGVPDRRMYLLINLAVGGTYIPPPDGDTRFPSVMAIDWVRVWRK